MEVAMFRNTKQESLLDSITGDKKQSTFSSQHHEKSC